MQSQLIKLRDALVSIENLKVYHYWHPRLEAPYCIWAEEGEGDSIWTSNHLHEQVIAGSVDYFTKLEFDPVVDEIQDKLEISEYEEYIDWNKINTQLKHFKDSSLKSIVL